MKKHCNILIICLVLEHFHLCCNAGLMDLIIRRGHRLFDHNNNVNNNQNINGQMTRVVQNYPGTIGAYNPGNIAGNNYNWRLPDAILKARDRINNNNLYNDETNSDNNNFPDNQLLNNQGVPFTNGNSINNNKLANAFITNSKKLNNNPVIDVDPKVNTPTSNTNTFQNNANIPKIVNDIKRINSIMDAIKKQNAANNRNKLNGGNFQTSNSYPNSNNSPTEAGDFTNNFPLVHVNNGQGALTNVNNNAYQNGANGQISSPFISNEPHYNVPPIKIPNNNDYNSGTNNHIISNPSTNTPLTNISPSEGVNNELNNYNVNTHHTKPIISHPSRNRHGNISEDIPKESKSISNTNDKKHEKDDQYALKPITKGKFFFQVEPVVPEYKIVRHNETIYYVN